MRASIVDDFAAPSGYVTRAERQRLGDEEAAADRARRELEATRSREHEEREATFQRDCGHRRDMMPRLIVAIATVWGPKFGESTASGLVAVTD